jgi:hypothetical protein
MIWVTAGTDVYGAVRKVDKTPVVTKFAMLQLMPIYPLESFYFARMGPASHAGIPFLLGQSSQSILGLRLARIDRTSVWTAYVRGIAAAILVVGFMGTLFGLYMTMTSNINPRDPVQRNLLPVAVAVLTAAVLLGAPTYYFTYVVPDREKRIRQFCGEILGIAADPAHVELETAKELIRLAREALARTGITEPTRAARNLAAASADQKRLLLVLARGMIAVKGTSDALEALADSILESVAGAAEL